MLLHTRREETLLGLPINKRVTPSFFVTVLSSKTTDRTQTGYQKYIESNPSWGELTLEVEKKLTANFFKSDKKSTWKPLAAGTTFKLEGQRLEKVGKLDVLKCKLGSKVGYIPINKIRKPTSTDVMKSEKIAMQQLGDKLRKFAKKVRPITICTKDGKKYENAYDVVDVTSRINGREPKADFAIINHKDEPILWISHKKAGGGAAFQQYGGLSKTKSGSDADPQLIWKHEETQRFLKELVKSHHDGVRIAGPRYATIQSSTLAAQSIFGPDYNSSGQNFGPDFCQMIGQGNPTLTWKGDEVCYDLSFDHYDMWNEIGSIMNSVMYKPIFGVTFRNGRSFEIDGEKYGGARAAIYPWGFMATRTGREEV